MPSHHSQKRPRGVASGSWDLDAAAPAVDTSDLGAALETEAQAVGLSLGMTQRPESRPNGLKIEKETTPDLVSTRRVAAMA